MTRDTLLYYAAPYFKSRTALFTILLILGLFFLRQRLRHFVPAFFAIFASRKWLVISLLLALTSRLLWFHFAPYETHTSWQNTEINESDIINIQALSAAEGKGVTDAEGHPSARRPYGYIYFLAFFYKILGPQPWVPVALQLILFLSLLLIFHALLSRHFPPGVNGIAAFGLALYPPLIVASNIVLDEYLFLPLWLGGVLIFLKRFPALPWKAALAMGFIWGLSTIVRTQSVIMPILLFLTGVILKHPLRDWALKCSVMMVVLLGVNLPLAMHNHSVGIPVYYTSSGNFVYSMLNPGSRGDMTPTPEKGEPYYSEEFHQAKNEAEAHQAGLKMARKWVLENPGDFLHLCTQKLLWFLSPDNSEWAFGLHADTGKRNGTKLPEGLVKYGKGLQKNIGVILIFSFLTLLILALFRFKIFLRVPAVFFLILTTLGWIGFHCLTNPYVKYRMPLELLLLPCVLTLLYGVLAEEDSTSGCCS